MFQLDSSGIKMKTQSSQIGNSLRIIIYEHASSGGYAGQPIPTDVLAEGFAILRSFTADLRAAGYKTTVLIDERLFKQNPPLETDCIIPVRYPDEPKRIIADIANTNDAIYVVAPETDQILQEMVEFCEGIGKITLNCKSTAIENATDKASLYEMLENQGFCIPQTLIRNVDCTVEELSQAIDMELSYPVLFKPVDGTSCNGISIVKNKNNVGPALSKIKNASKNKCFIIQQYVKGDSASASVLSNGKKARTISLNHQLINIAEPDCESKYTGGYIPFKHILKGDAEVLAEKVVESISGLRGYVGVDLVLTNNEVFVVDVNPRLTTSYVGLHRVAGFNVAVAIVDAVVNSKLPVFAENQGFACFSKVETNVPSTIAFQQASKMDFVVTPPFSLVNNDKSIALVSVVGNNLDQACLRLEEAKKNLIDIVT
jgi:tyramine---L-glutamate ligase